MMAACEGPPPAWHTAELLSNGFHARALSRGASDCSSGCLPFLASSVRRQHRAGAGEREGGVRVSPGEGGDGGWGVGGLKGWPGHGQHSCLSSLVLQLGALCL